MLIRFIYVANNEEYPQPSTINFKLGIFISFVICVGFAPITFVIFIIKSIDD